MSRTRVISGRTDTVAFEQMTSKHIQVDRLLILEWCSSLLSLDRWITFLYDVEHLRFKENGILHVDWSES